MVCRRKMPSEDKAPQAGFTGSSGGLHKRSEEESRNGVASNACGARHIRCLQVLIGNTLKRRVASGGVDAAVIRDARRRDTR